MESYVSIVEPNNLRATLEPTPEELAVLEYKRLITSVDVLEPDPEPVAVLGKTVASKYTPVN
jgi:hypothetical protein